MTLGGVFYAVLCVSLCFLSFNRHFYAEARKDTQKTAE